LAKKMQEMIRTCLKKSWLLFFKFSKFFYNEKIK
jgi:hypothetical protein